MGINQYPQNGFQSFVPGFQVDYGLNNSMPQVQPIRPLNQVTPPNVGVNGIKPWTNPFGNTNLHGIATVSGPIDANLSDTDWVNYYANNDPTGIQYARMNPQQIQLAMNNPDAAKLLRANQGSNLGSTMDQMSAFQNQMKNNQWTMKDTLGAFQTGIQALSSLGNLWMGYKQMKMAKEQLRENLALQRANYRNTAKAMNAQYRDQASGRGSAVQSGRATREAGKLYQNRRVSETY